jgi:hypothetical protein
MIARAIERSPERAAWTVLLSSFFTFVALLGTVVFGGRWWLQNAQVDQGIKLAVSGTVLVTRPGRPAPEVGIFDIPVGSTISTEPTAQGTLTFVGPDGRQVLATVSVFGSTIVEIDEANSPRYRTGVQPHRITLKVTSGRIRATVGVDVPRQVRIQVLSAPGAVTVLDTPGSNVSIQADPTQTMVTVREGAAVVTAQGTAVPLGKDQRAAVRPGSPPNVALSAEQNLVQNGDFATPFDGSWQVQALAPADPSEQPGTAVITTVNGRRTVQLARQGNNWGHVGITQDINRDVQGLTSLRLNMDGFIGGQDLRNCGLYGTECPLMVKITYVDVGGGQHEWLQGFYWSYDPNPAAGLTYCGSCQVHFVHILWGLGQWQTYSSDNLLQIFQANGPPAASIKSISIYGEGHTYSSQFTDVQLLASE